MFLYDFSHQDSYTDGTNVVQMYVGNHCCFEFMSTTTISPLVFYITSCHFICLIFFSPIILDRSLIPGSWWRGPIQGWTLQNYYYHPSQKSYWELKDTWKIILFRGITSFYKICLFSANNVLLMLTQAIPIELVTYMHTYTHDNKTLIQEKGLGIDFVGEG